MEEVLQQAVEKLLICLSTHNQQKHRSNLFLKNHLAGFIQSSRILMESLKKDLLFLKGIV